MQKRKYCKTSLFELTGIYVQNIWPVNIVQTFTQTENVRVKVILLFIL